MKKKTVIIIVAVLAVLLLGVYALYINMFPKAEPIKQLEISMLESVNLHDNDNTEIVLSEEDLQKLINYINSAVPTRTMSVNDYPAVRPYYVVEIKTVEGIFGYMIYEDNGTAYVELPYEGVYEIDREAVEIMRGHYCGSVGYSWFNGKIFCRWIYNGCFK